MKSISWRSVLRSLMRRRLLLLTILAYGVIGVIDPSILIRSLNYLKAFLIEMAQVLPIVLLATALLDEWVPANLITRHLGPGSGVRGVIFSYILGSVSAGPIYAAFPMCRSLYKKGASVSNVVIIVSAWAVIKVPMLLMEIKFLGPAFAGVRYAITVPAILILGLLMGRISDLRIPEHTGPDDSEREAQSDPDAARRLSMLPGRDCKACGYPSCAEMAAAVTDEARMREACVFLD